MSQATMTQHESRAHELAEKFIEFLETGVPPAGLLAPDAFCDLTVPTWRLQAAGADGTVALRRAGHPATGVVPRWRFDPTPTGFVLEFEEAWEADGDHWTCREMARADISDSGITELSVYCTGDWDTARRSEHASAVTLIRP
jgi:hypothetical protein